MKTIYVRKTSYNQFGYEITTAVVYKEYPEFGVAITKISYKDLYTITDIKTGLSCGRSFTKLKDAKSFMEHTEELNFKNWYDAVENARKTERYHKSIIEVR